MSPLNQMISQILFHQFFNINSALELGILLLTVYLIGNVKMLVKSITLAGSGDTVRLIAPTLINTSCGIA